MRRTTAFTLVELLVALAITVVLVLLLASVVAATLGAWTQGRNRLDTSSKARQILGRLSDELKGATANSALGGSQIQFVENAALGAVPSPTPGTAENAFFVARSRGRPISSRRLHLQIHRLACYFYGCYPIRSQVLFSE